VSRRVLVALQAGDAYPSGNVRGLAFRSHFERKGDTVHYMNIRPPSLVRLKEKVPRALRLPVVAARTGMAAVNGIRLLHVAPEYDAIYLQKVTSQLLVSELRKRTTARIVLDVVDALWSDSSDVHGLEETIKLADAVTTDNEYTAEWLRKHQPECTVIPDSPQLEAFDELRSKPRVRADSGTLTLGWIGSRSTVFGLYAAWEALERLFERHGHLHLRIVGAGYDPRLLPPFAKVKYSVVPSYDQRQMIEEVLAMDIGLFPLHDVEDSVTRGILKACIYWAGETAVVASAIGQAVDVIQDGENGMLAHSPAEWLEKLDRVVSDPGLRLRLSAAGLETVRRSFTTEKSFNTLYSVLFPS